MSLQEIEQLIVNIGFPIVVCLILLFQNKKITEKLSDAVFANTQAIRELIIRLDTHFYVEHGERISDKNDSIIH